MREWLKVMLEEIRRKGSERSEAAAEHRRRGEPEPGGAPDAGEGPAAGRPAPGEDGKGPERDGDT